MFVPHSNEANLILRKIVSFSGNFNLQHTSSSGLGYKNTIRVRISYDSTSLGTIHHVKKDIDLCKGDRFANVINNMEFHPCIGTVVTGILKRAGHRRIYLLRRTSNQDRNCDNTIFKHITTH